MANNPLVLQPAPNPVNRYIHLEPNPDAAERSATRWKVARWFVTIGFTLLAAGTYFYVGMVASSYLLPVTMGIALLSIRAYAFVTRCIANEGAYAERAQFERDIARRAENPVIDGMPQVQPAHRFIAARYLYWHEQSRENISNRVRLNDPHHAIRYVHRRHVFQERERAIHAKVQAAYFRAILQRPNLTEELEELVLFAFSGPHVDNQQLNRALYNQLLRWLNLPPEQPDTYLELRELRDDVERWHPLTFNEAYEISEEDLTLRMLQGAAH